MGRLSTASEMDLSGRTAPLRVAAASIVGGDAMGSFHSAQQQKAGVTTLSHPIPDSCTGSLTSSLIIEPTQLEAATLYIQIKLWSCKSLPSILNRKGLSANE